MNKKRLPLLDALRGAAIYSMIAYHFLYDVNIVGGANPAWDAQNWVIFWQKWGMGLFVLVSGMSCTLMRGEARWRRGLFLNVLGLLITIATIYFLPQEKIIFGILNFFGSALLFTQLVIYVARRLNLKILRSKILQVFLCVLGFIFLRNLADGAVTCGTKIICEIPQAWQVDALAPFGLHGAEFFSADYVPLLPHIFLFWLGFILHEVLRERNQNLYARIMGRGDYKILTLAGRNSLVIYLAHQPLLIFALGLL